MRNNNQYSKDYLNLRNVVIAMTFMLMLGGVIGYHLFPQIGVVSKHCKLEYISQDELISLENKRIALEGSENKETDMFFGEIKQVIKLISEFAGKRQSRNNRVLLTAGSIQGDNVSSISEEIYQLVIKELKKGETKTPMRDEIKLKKPILKELRRKRALTNE